MSPTTRQRSGRAAPMSPPERRAAIISATIPLLRAHGLSITTRQIAEAAAVAEGTIFSVFDDKDSLIAAAVEVALDPAATILLIGAIDGARPLGERLVEAARIIQAHFAETWQLLVAVGPDTKPKAPGPRPDEAPAAFRAALVPLLAPAAHQLRRSPAEAAQALLALTLGCSHPALVERPMPPEEIVDLLLEGLLRHPTPRDDR